MSRNTGGAAFPRPMGHNGMTHHEEHEASEAQQGMTLRDYFAAKAMQAMITGGPNIIYRDATGNMVTDATPAFRAQCAYAEADAMLAERAK